MQQYRSQERLSLKHEGCEATLWTAQGPVSSIQSIEVLDTETEIVLTVAMVDVVGQTLDIQVSAETLYVAGEQQTIVQGKTYWEFESSFHPFQHIIPLPELVHPPTAIAQFMDNTLTVRLQKTSKPRQSIQLNLQDGWEDPVPDVVSPVFPQSVAQALGELAR